MKLTLHTLLQLMTTVIRSRLSLQLEIVALRHQLAVYQRTAKRPQISAGDRLLWSWLSRRWPGWRGALVFVQTGTVIAWQRKRFREHWANLSRHDKTGRPPVPKEIRELISKMSEANVSWGSPRIVGELHKLGIDVAESTVDKYLVRSRKTTLSDVEGLSEQSCQGPGVYRFLRGTHGEKQGAVRFGGPGASLSQGRRLQCDGAPYGSVDRPAIS